MLLGLIKLFAFGLLLALAAAVWMVVDRLRNPPRRTMAWALARRLPADPSELIPPRPFQPFDFPAPAAGHPQRALPAWDIAGDNPRGPVIIAAHGWGDSRIGILPRLPALARHASRIIALDLAAHGESQPSAGRCALGTKQDVDDLISLARFLGSSVLPPPREEGRGEGLDQPQSPAHVPSPPLLLYGWSLGAGISIVAAKSLRAERMPIAAVIAEAPYRHAHTPVTNYLRLLQLPYRANAPIAMAILGWRLGVGPRWTGFDRAAHARDLGCPLLVLHGADDEICPHEGGQAIAAAAAPRSIFLSVPNAQHNNLWTEEPFATQCTQAVSSFIMSIAQPLTAAPVPPRVS